MVLRCGLRFKSRPPQTPPPSRPHRPSPLPAVPPAHAAPASRKRQSALRWRPQSTTRSSPAPPPPPCAPGARTPGRSSAATHTHRKALSRDSMRDTPRHLQTPQTAPVPLPKNPAHLSPRLLESWAHTPQSMPLRVAPPSQLCVGLPHAMSSCLFVTARRPTH
jgi:hypothetical protein